VMLEAPPFCVLWKPAGWTVNVSSREGGYRGAGCPGPELGAWVAEVLGSNYAIARDAAVSHGLLHRLDRDTSGALLWAKSYEGFYAGLLEFSANNVRKAYVCLCAGWLLAEPRLITRPLLEAGTGDQLITRVAADGFGRRAVTEISAVAHLEVDLGDVALDDEKKTAGRFSLVEVRIYSGRRHQIRAHLASEGHPLVCDTTYGAPPISWCPRLFLHAHRLGIDIGSGPVDARAALPADLRKALSNLRPAGNGGSAGNTAEVMLRKWQSGGS